MGVFGAFFGRIGDGGFNGCCSGACSGVVGFKVAMGGVLCAKKFALRAHNGPKLAFSGVLGEFIRGNAAVGAVLGEFFGANRPCAQVL